MSPCLADVGALPHFTKVEAKIQYTGNYVLEAKYLQNILLSISIILFITKKFKSTMGEFEVELTWY